MLELGKYASAVLTAWGVTFLVLGGLIAMTWVQSRKARRELDAIEARRAAKES